jgi:hypothetical protein
MGETIKHKRSKAMDMRYHSLTDRVRLKQFDFCWRPGRENLADYHTKHHSGQHHKDMRTPTTPPTPCARPHGRTDESKRPESHPTKKCARARVRCLSTEPNYYYCPIALVMSSLIALV